MILRKRKITIIVIIVTTILIASSVLAFLYLKTDMFKSKETLFAKYLLQNFNITEILKNEDILGIDKLLSENKYESELDGKIEYTENIGTSAENRNNSINNVGIKVNSNIDKTNKYFYRNISIKNAEEDLVKFEYLNEQQNYGLRLNGIKQFVSINEETDNEILEGIDVESIKNLTSEIDINSILNFNEEEKQKLRDTYLGILQSKIPKEKYFKQSNSLITVNKKDIQTNAYGVKMTIEEYNNIFIDILTQISKDEIILSKIDLIEKEIKERNTDYESEEDLRTKFINKIKDMIKEIQDHNIGNEEIRITTYENKQKTVRTAIEKNTNKITIDLYDESSVMVNILQLGEEVKEAYIKIEKDKSNSILVECGIIENNEIVNSLKYNFEQTLQDNKINKKIDVEISNLKSKLAFKIDNNINIVQEFSDKISLDTDNILLNDLNEQQLEIVTSTVMDVLNNQITNLLTFISKDDVVGILESLGYENKNSIELPSQDEISEVEKKRFNTQFEFFVSENLTTNNIKELMDVAENDFEDMKVLLKTGEIQDLDMDKLNSEDSKSYIDNISEILFFIKSNTSNNEKKDDVLEFLDKFSNNKYNVFIQYDDNGFVRVMRIQVQEEE